MRILIATPAPRGSTKGNRVTAERWKKVLRGLGHRVAVIEQYAEQDADVLIALHARKSHPSVRRFRRHWPGRPIVVALTGTDLYGDIHALRAARQSLELADRLVVLQPAGLRELPLVFREKARVIHQSVELPPAVEKIVEGRGRLRGRRARTSGKFEVCVLGHLRPVKDPFRAAMAARLLPPESGIRITHVGGALSAAMEIRARREMVDNRRYRWLGGLPRPRALAVLARSDLLVLTSLMEGGANAISEAIATGVPVLSSRISGSIGLLGRDYPGYFAVGDHAGLARLMRRCEVDRGFYADLKRRCAQLRPVFEPGRERTAWRNLLAEFR